MATLEIEQPDLLLVEPGVRWLDGVALVRALKRNPRFRDLPVLFVSDRRRPSALEAGYRAGVADYFIEPLHLGALLERVEEILGEWRHGRR